MRFLSGRLIVAAGVALTMVGLLAFSLGSPDIVVGQETDVDLPDVEEPAEPPASLPEESPEGDVGAGAEGPADPPASLPSSGTGGYAESTGFTTMLVVTLLAALGVTLAGAGVIALRLGRRVQGS